MDTQCTKSQELKAKKTVIQLILEENGLTMTEFAVMLFGEKQSAKAPLNRLNQYRKGLREFRLNMEQIKVINRLLRPLELTIDDLPDDWILDKD